MLEKWAMILLIGIALFGAGFIKGCHSAQDEHIAFVATMDAQSQKLLNSILVKNAAEKAKSDAEAKQKDEQHAKTIADINLRAAAARNRKLYDPGSQGCGSPAATGTNGAGKSESPAAGRELSGKLTEFLITEAARADEAHAYAVTCYEFVNRKSIRTQVNSMRGAK